MSIFKVLLAFIILISQATEMEAKKGGKKGARPQKMMKPTTSTPTSTPTKSRSLKPSIDNWGFSFSI